jgi:hypothetical protein
LSALTDLGAKVDGLGARGWFGGLGSGDGGWLGGGFGLEDLAGTGNGVALVVEEALDAEGGFDVALAVEALACAAFVGLELVEFGLPEAEDVGGDVAEASDVADAEVELIGDDNRLGGDGLANWVVGTHDLNTKYRCGRGGSPVV